MQTLCHGLRRPFAPQCLLIYAGIAIHAGALYSDMQTKCTLRYLLPRISATADIRQARPQARLRQAALPTAMTH